MHDRFHVAKHLNKAVDQTRRQEAAKLDDVVAVWASHQIGMRDVVADIGDKISPRQILVAAGMLAPLSPLHVRTRIDAVGREFVPLAAQQFLTRWFRLAPRGRIDPAEIKRKLS